ncbi:MAG TPA: chromate transporter [Ktedonobacteraceae bacterium]|nr:chromate transporter [Ktedonobacteraceae bacterium]
MNSQNPRPGMWKLFRIWASIGLQSFGGGASTTFLIQRTFIEKYHWMTMEEFTHFWSLSILTPGINLLGLTILMGRKLGGSWGIVMSLAGLLLPSAAITCILAALFKQIEGIPATQMVLRGIVPATGAIMAVVAINFARPIMRKSYKEGAFSLLKNSIVILAGALAIIFLNLSAIAVVLGAVVLGALIFSPKAESPIQSEKEG